MTLLVGTSTERAIQVWSINDKWKWQGGKRSCPNLRYYRIFSNLIRTPFTVSEG